MYYYLTLSRGWEDTDLTSGIFLKCSDKKESSIRKEEKKDE